MRKLLLLAAVTVLAGCSGRSDPDQTSSEGAVLPSAGGEDTTAVTDTTTADTTAVSDPNVYGDTSMVGRDTSMVSDTSMVGPDTSMAQPPSQNDPSMGGPPISDDSLRILCGRFAMGDTTEILSDTTWTSDRLRTRCENLPMDHQNQQMNQDSTFQQDTSTVQPGRDSTPQ